MVDYCVVIFYVLGLLTVAVFTFCRGLYWAHTTVGVATVDPWEIQVLMLVYWCTSVGSLCLAKKLFNRI